MAKLSRRQIKKEKKKREQETDPTSPWIGMQTGLTIVTILSIVMAVLVTWTVIPTTKTAKASCGDWVLEQLYGLSSFLAFCA